MINVAAVCPRTEALGPGVRAVVWVQGCPFDCPGCLAPEWIPDRAARLVEVDALADELLADPAVAGLTFSGGEPMAQARALAALARHARRRRPLTLICFTGFRLAELRRHPPSPGVAELLAEVDVLIDGRYVARLNDGRGLRGSSNQGVHHLSDRLGADEYDYLGRPRNAEVHLSAGGDALLVGVPPVGLLEALDRGADLLAARHFEGDANSGRAIEPRTESNR